MLHVIKHENQHIEDFILFSKIENFLCLFDVDAKSREYQDDKSHENIRRTKVSRIKYFDIIMYCNGQMWNF